MKEKQHIALVTGTLAEPAVRAMARRLAEDFELTAQVLVLNIQVAALMTVPWVQRKLTLASGPKPDCVILPGYCRGGLETIAQKLDTKVQHGPRDLHDLPRMFAQGNKTISDYRHDGPYDIEIIAEINDAAHLPAKQIISQAQALVRDGADVIDIGCDPQADRAPWKGVGDVVRALRDRGMRVSVDSFCAQEVAIGCAAGAELVLSVNGSNCQAASEWGVPVVVVPNNPQTLGGLDQTINQLEKDGVSYRIDPVVEPIGMGFASSLGRYLETRKRYPDAPMMMGIGNLSEMTGCDSAGINLLLIGFCQELHITSVLTTQVINWAQSAVREIDVARRICHFAVTRHTLPKHLDDRLVMLRAARLRKLGEDELLQLAKKLTDRNIRIFADHRHNRLHAMNNRVHAQGADPFVLFDQLGIDDAAHAFYLGYEIAKATIALELGKNYTQDQALDWGLLTYGRNDEEISS